MYEGRTKNKSSERDIRLSSTVLQDLRKYKVWQLEQQLMLGDQWQNTGYMFTNDFGNPLHPDTVSSWFSGFIKKHPEIPPISLHSLRHPYVKLKTKKFEDFYYESRRTDFTLPPALALWLVRCQKVIANVIYLNTIVLEDIYTAYQAVRK